MMPSRVRSLSCTVAASLLALALASAVGCGPPPIAEQVEQHRAALKAKLDALAALGPVAAAAPAVEQDAIAWPAADLVMRYPERNTLLLHLEEFDDLALRMALPVRASNRSPSVDVARLAGWSSPRKSNLPTDPDYDPGGSTPDMVHKLFGQFLATKYVLVLRTLSYVPAQLIGDRKFKAGTYAGEVLVYQLDGQRLLGGFRFDVRSTQSIGTKAGRDRQNLAADMHFQVQRGVRGKLVKATPALQGKGAVWFH